MEYHKIHGLFKRYTKDDKDAGIIPDGKKVGDFITGEFAKEEFKILFHNQWIWTEKLDGMNIRIYLYREEENDNFTIIVKGRTDKADISDDLLNSIYTWFHENEEKINNTFTKTNNLILYGEGVGKKIQKGSIFGEQHFKLFDVKIGKFWLKRDDVINIANKISLSTPLYWMGTITDAVGRAITEPKSEFGNFTIEGYVGVPVGDFLDRSGNRIITKIKVKDFVKG